MTASGWGAAFWEKSESIQEVGEEVVEVAVDVDEKVATGSGDGAGGEVEAVCK